MKKETIERNEKLVKQFEKEFTNPLQQKATYVYTQLAEKFNLSFASVAIVCKNKAKEIRNRNGKLSIK
jgi:hypothetical protein